MSLGFWKTALVILAAVIALSVGETLIAKGMRQVTAMPSGWLAYVRAAVSNGWVVAGGVLLAVHLGLYAVALGEADLSVVMPMTAASYPLGAVLARFALHEEVSLTRWLGTAAITLGVALIAWGEATSPK
jgi:drug/metabolite transporter (DMT)-like permease